jgi:hypothetical protein
MEAIAAECVKQGVRFLKPKKHVDTRWDSEYMMLVVLLSIFVVLTHLWEHNLLDTASKTGATSYQIDSVGHKRMEQLVVVLARPERSTRLLEASQTVTISQVYPEVMRLYNFMGSPTLQGDECGVECLKGKRWQLQDKDARKVGRQFHGMTVMRMLVMMMTMMILVSYT